ncbi:MAG: hypothetical protein BWZ07_03099 [Alphaproteobacteria bacterium ADurb.BinA280]|nr:MAG: hypothetical protein BWZ07_03099 [Alphaproteobacteria bacterium ADurb.BinA280]
MRSHCVRIAFGVRLVFAPSSIRRCLRFALLVLILGKLFVAAGVPPQVTVAGEKLVQHITDCRTLFRAASSDKPHHLGLWNRLFPGVVDVQKAPVNAVLKQAQVRRVLEVVADMALVVVHSALTANSPICSRHASLMFCTAEAGVSKDSSASALDGPCHDSSLKIEQARVQVAMHVSGGDFASALRCNELIVVVQRICPPRIASATACSGEFAPSKSSISTHC